MTINGLLKKILCKFYSRWTSALH